MLVNYLVMSELLLKLSTPGFRRPLVLFADAMSIPQGLQISKVV
jgi:hypothetical protein